MEFQHKGWDIVVSRDSEDKDYSIGVSASWDSAKRYEDMNRCHVYAIRPRSVTELIEFADIIGELLNETAKALRAEGLEQLRAPDRT